MADEQTVAVGHDANEAHSPAREVEHLRRARVKDELCDVLAHQLLRADAYIDRNSVLREQLVRAHVLGRADARDLGRRMEHRVRNLARDHVGFVGVRQCDDNVGVVRAGAVEHLGISGVSDDSTDVETVLEFSQDFGPHVDNRYFVRLFTRQVIGG